MVTTTIRNCHPCTACCGGWIRINEENISSSVGHPCPHLGEQGCNQYDSRPQICRDFQCAWISDTTNIPVWMRPDKAKVIVRYANWIPESRVMLAIPVGATIPEKSLKYLKQFALGTKTPLLVFERILENGDYTRSLSISAVGTADMEPLFAKISPFVNRAEQMA